MKKQSQKVDRARPPTKEEEYLLGWKRARAELLNLQRRQEDEAVASRARLKAQVVEPLLALADNFQALAQHVPEDMKDNPWTHGVVHIAREFERVLRDQGVEVVSPKDEEFNPLLHEAIEEVEGETPNIVTDVVQVGYRMGDTVLRAAKVKVSK